MNMFRKFEKVTIQWIKLSTFRATDPSRLKFNPGLALIVVWTEQPAPDGLSIVKV